MSESDKVPYDAGDEAQVEKHKTKAKLKKEDLDDAWKEVLKTRQGRLVLWDILSRCEIYGGTFTGNSSTFFKEGRRSIGTELLVSIKQADEMAYINMQIEALKRGK